MDRVALSCCHVLLSCSMPRYRHFACTMESPIPKAATRGHECVTQPSSDLQAEPRNTLSKSSHPNTHRLQMCTRTPLRPAALPRRRNTRSPVAVDGHIHGGDKCCHLTDHGAVEERASDEHKNAERALEVVVGTHVITNLGMHWEGAHTQTHTQTRTPTLA